eukprot:GFKZ01007359.1.p1 GENE.GFKZ01007359.1~~GFKZ01007359.1.p1  ORF type:complete len:124 (+),score=6.77 GFKZ01007359.1:1089-1460(+)
MRRVGLQLQWMRMGMLLRVGWIYVDIVALYGGAWWERASRLAARRIWRLRAGTSYRPVANDTEPGERGMALSTRSNVGFSGNSSVLCKAPSPSIVQNCAVQYLGAGLFEIGTYSGFACTVQYK